MNLVKPGRNLLWRRRGKGGELQNSRPSICAHISLMRALSHLAILISEVVEKGGEPSLAGPVGSQALQILWGVKPCRRKWARWRNFVGDPLGKKMTTHVVKFVSRLGPWCVPRDDLPHRATAAFESGTTVRVTGGVNSAVVSTTRSHRRGQ